MKTASEFRYVPDTARVDLLMLARVGFNIGKSHFLGHEPWTAYAIRWDMEPAVDPESLGTNVVDAGHGNSPRWARAG